MKKTLKLISAGLIVLTSYLPMSCAPPQKSIIYENAPSKSLEGKTIIYGISDFYPGRYPGGYPGAPYWEFNPDTEEWTYIPGEEFVEVAPEPLIPPEEN